MRAFPPLTPRRSGCAPPSSSQDEKGKPYQRGGKRWCHSRHMRRIERTGRSESRQRRRDAFEPGASGGGKGSQAAIDAFTERGRRPRAARSCGESECRAKSTVQKRRCAARRARHRDDTRLAPTRLLSIEVARLLEAFANPPPTRNASRSPIARPKRGSGTRFPALGTRRARLKELQSANSIAARAHASVRQPWSAIV